MPYPDSERYNDSLGLSDRTLGGGSCLGLRKLSGQCGLREEGSITAYPSGVCTIAKAGCYKLPRLLNLIGRGNMAKVLCLTGPSI